MADPDRSSPIEIEEQLTKDVREEEEPVEEQKWGRVLICGGTNCNGKKERPAEMSASEFTGDTYVNPLKLCSNSDITFPHILRSLCHIKVVTLITGPAANYAAVIDIHGIAYLFGRLPCAALAPGTTDVVSEKAPIKVSARSVGLPRGTKWVGGAAARSHLLLIASDGTVWGIGNNVFGQLGLPPGQEISKWTKITGPWSRQPEAKIIQVTAGHTFSLYLTNLGQIFASGSSESGQLGNGKTGERLLKGGKVGFDIEAPPRLVGGLTGKKMVQIASGNQHSLALDDEGYVYAWGYAGYARLGLQDQKDRLVPTIVPQFTGKNEMTRGKSVLCGPANSVVADKQGMYYMAGKWKNTGDGSHGAPYTTFKTIQDILKASSGGCTHFLTTADPDGGVMTVGFGQGCLYGELGLGPDFGKSSTKPVKLEPLVGIDVIDVAAGAFCTLFLARPNAELPEVPRWPLHIKTPDICVVCKKKESDPLECERCDMPYHPGCLDPPLFAIPEGEWFCPKCEAEMQTSPEEEEEMAGRNLGSPEPARKKQGTPVGRAKSGTPASRGKKGTPVSTGKPSSKGSASSPSGRKRKAEDDGGRPKSRLQNVTRDSEDDQSD